jgi:hypothetical protein
MNTELQKARDNVNDLIYDAKEWIEETENKHLLKDLENPLNSDNFYINEDTEDEDDEWIAWERCKEMFKAIKELAIIEQEIYAASKKQS